MTNLSQFHSQGGGGKLIIYEKGNNKVNNKRYRRTNRLMDLERYKLVRNQVNSAIRSDKVNENKTKFLSFKENSKAFLDM